MTDIFQLGVPPGASRRCGLAALTGAEGTNKHTYFGRVFVDSATVISGFSHGKASTCGLPPASTLFGSEGVNLTHADEAKCTPGIEIVQSRSDRHIVSQQSRLTLCLFTDSATRFPNSKIVQRRSTGARLGRKRLVMVWQHIARHPFSSNLQGCFSSAVLHHHGEKPCPLTYMPRPHGEKPHPVSLASLSLTH